MPYTLVMMNHMKIFIGVTQVLVSHFNYATKVLTTIILFQFLETFAVLTMIFLSKPQTYSTLLKKNN